MASRVRQLWDYDNYLPDPATGLAMDVLADNRQQTHLESYGESYWGTWEVRPVSWRISR